MECVYEYTEGRLCRGVALRLLLLLMAQMDLDVGHGIFNGRHCSARICSSLSEHLCAHECWAYVWSVHGGRVVIKNPTVTATKGAGHAQARRCACAAL